MYNTESQSGHCLELWQPIRVMSISRLLGNSKADMINELTSKKTDFFIYILLLSCISSA